MAKILIIDDDRNIRSAMEAILTRVGHKVDTTKFLATAVGDALSGKYDLVTLDLNMPGIDGVEIAHLLQKQGSKTSILVVSGFLNEETTGQLQEAGVHNFLDKSFNATDLPEAVDQALAS
jgi:two-component system response regulator HydG